MRRCDGRSRDHRRGELDVAEAICDALLQREPRRPDALNFMGMLRLQRGHADRALELLQRTALVALGRAPSTSWSRPTR